MYNPLKKLLNPDEDIWNIHSSTYGSNDNFKKHTESYSPEKYSSSKDSSVYSKASGDYLRNDEIKEEDTKRIEQEEDSIAKRVEREISSNTTNLKDEDNAIMPTALNTAHHTVHTVHQGISSPNAIPKPAVKAGQAKKANLKESDANATKSIEEAIEDAVSKIPEEKKIIVLE